MRHFAEHIKYQQVHGFMIAGQQTGRNDSFALSRGARGKGIADEVRRDWRLPANPLHLLVLGEGPVQPGVQVLSQTLLLRDAQIG